MASISAFDFRWTAPARFRGIRPTTRRPPRRSAAYTWSMLPLRGDSHQQPPRLIVPDERGRGLPEYREPRAHRFRLIVGPVDQRLSGVVAESVPLGGVEVDVVDTSAGRGPPSRNAPEEHRLGRFQERGGVDGASLAGEHAIQRLGLRDGPRKAVEDHAPFRIHGAQMRAHEVDDDVVGNEFTRVHVPLRLVAQRCPRAAGGAQQVPRRDVRPPEFATEPHSLRSLAHPRRTQKDDDRARGVHHGRLARQANGGCCPGAAWTSPTCTAAGRASSPGPSS